MLTDKKCASNGEHGVLLLRNAHVQHHEKTRARAQEVLLFFLAFGIGGKILYGVAQMNSLLNHAKRTPDSHQVAMG